MCADLDDDHDIEGMFTVLGMERWKSGFSTLSDWVSRSAEEEKKGMIGRLDG